MSQLTKELFLSGAKFKRANDNGYNAPVYQFVKSDGQMSEGYIRIYEGDTREFHACLASVSDTRIIAFKLILGEPVTVELALSLFIIHEVKEVANV